jgi:hypothetical protein
VWLGIGGHVAIAFGDLLARERGDRDARTASDRAARDHRGADARHRCDRAVRVGRNRRAGVGAMLATPGRCTAARSGARSSVGHRRVSFWATLALNIPDYLALREDAARAVARADSRCRSSMALFSFVGIAVTSATQSSSTARRCGTRSICC